MFGGDRRKSDQYLFAESVNRQLEHLSGSVIGVMHLTNPTAVPSRWGGGTSGHYGETEGFCQRRQGSQKASMSSDDLQVRGLRSRFP